MSGPRLTRHGASGGKPAVVLSVTVPATGDQPFALLTCERGHGAGAFSWWQRPRPAAVAAARWVVARARASRARPAVAPRS